MYGRLHFNPFKRTLFLLLNKYSSLSQLTRKSTAEIINLGRKQTFSKFLKVDSLNLAFDKFFNFLFIISTKPFEVMRALLEIVIMQ